MLLKYNNHPAIKAVILTSLLSLLASCSNSAAIESLVSADPLLKEGEIGQQINTTKAQLAPDSATKASDIASQDQKIVAQETQAGDLPFNFPDSFPVYPQAELQEMKSEADNSGMLVWNTTDNRKAVADYYQTELLANDWEIIKPFTINPQQKITRAIAIKDDLRAELTLSQSTASSKSDSTETQLAVIYHPLSQDIPKSGISQASNAAENSEQPKNNQAKAQPKATQQNDNNYFDSSNAADFADLDEVSEQLQQPLKSVAALGILTPYTGKANVELSQFAPNEIITRLTLSCLNLLPMK